MKAFESAVEELRSNADQWQAFESTGHCVTLAGPGSGKTKVLTTKMARILREEVREPRGVACVTYSNECARELERRLARLGIEGRPNVFVGTLHSFCLKFVLVPLAKLVAIPVPEPLAIASEAVQCQALEEAMDEVGVRTDGFRTDLDRFRRTAVAREVGTDGWEPGDRGLTDTCLAYERRLRGLGRIDFDDIVLLAVRAAERSEVVRRCLRARFPVLCVDEYQDLGVPLHRLVHLLAFAGGVRLFAVGDPDQSIYGFTGARPDLLRDLSARPDVARVELRTNYRSGRRIVAASELVIGNNRNFLAHSKDEGRVVFTHCPLGLDAQVAHVANTIIPAAIGDGDPHGEVALLYPTQQEGDALEQGLLSAAIPYVRLDRGAGYRRTPLVRFVEDLAAWCCGGWSLGKPSLSSLLGRWRTFLPRLEATEARATRRDLVRFAFANRDPVGLASTWLAQLKGGVLAKRLPTIDEDERDAITQLIDTCSSGGDLAQLDIGMFAGKSGSPEHVVLMNLHTAKGTEFNTVVLVGMDRGRMPIHHARTAEKLAEQRRLFFVGVSRARRALHILYSGWTRNQYGRRFDEGPSPFVLELERNLRSSQ